MEITSVAYTVFSMKYEYEHCDQVFFVTFHTEGWNKEMKIELVSLGSLVRLLQLLRCDEFHKFKKSHRSSKKQLKG